jgi:hypothetical protein
MPALEEGAANSIRARVGGRCCCVRPHRAAMPWLRHLGFSPTTEVCWPSPQLSRPWHPCPHRPSSSASSPPHHPSSKHFGDVVPEPRVIVTGLDPTQLASPQPWPMLRFCLPAPLPLASPRIWPVLYFCLASPLLSIRTTLSIKFSCNNQ